MYSLPDGEGIMFLGCPFVHSPIPRTVFAIYVKRIGKYSIAHTDDLILEVKRSSVKVTTGGRGGKGIHFDAGVGLCTLVSAGVFFTIERLLLTWQKCLWYEVFSRNL